DAEIARRFGYNRAYIQTLRAAMGLPARRGKVACKDMDKSILSMRDDDCMTWANIARAIHEKPDWKGEDLVKAAKAIAERYTRLTLENEEAESIVPLIITKKKCLKCR